MVMIPFQDKDDQIPLCVIVNVKYGMMEKDFLTFQSKNHMSMAELSSQCM